MFVVNFDEANKGNVTTLGIITREVLNPTLNPQLHPDPSTLNPKLSNLNSKP